jgi:tRNA threonylcarbamoyladenosine biosynthesis protein TsaB
VKVIAFDTAMKSCAVACIEVGQRHGEPNILAEERVDMSRGQAEELVPMIARVMVHANLEFDDIDRIALSIGPGTFTGLRTGLATARGLGLASGKPVIGIGTLLALAWDYGDATAPTGPFAIVLDARRGQVYMQVFSSSRKSLSEPQVSDVESAAGILPIGKISLVGSGAEIVMQASGRSANEMQIGRLPNENGPNPVTIARIAATQKANSAPPSLMYLRPPDAKPQTHVPIARQ